MATEAVFAIGDEVLLWESPTNIKGRVVGIWHSEERKTRYSVRFWKDDQVRVEDWFSGFELVKLDETGS